MIGMQEAAPKAPADDDGDDDDMPKEPKAVDPFAALPPSKMSMDTWKKARRRYGLLATRVSPVARATILVPPERPILMCPDLSSSLASCSQFLAGVCTFPLSNPRRTRTPSTTTTPPWFRSGRSSWIVRTTRCVFWPCICAVSSSRHAASLQFLWLLVAVPKQCSYDVWFALRWVPFFLLLSGH